MTLTFCVADVCSFFLLFFPALGPSLSFVRSKKILSHLNIGRENTGFRTCSKIRPFHQHHHEHIFQEPLFIGWSSCCPIIYAPWFRARKHFFPSILGSETLFNCTTFFLTKKKRPTNIHNDHLTTRQKPRGKKKKKSVGKTDLARKTAIQIVRCSDHP